MSQVVSNKLPPQVPCKNREVLHACTIRSSDELDYPGSGASKGTNVSHSLVIACEDGARNPFRVGVTVMGSSNSPQGWQAGRDSHDFKALAVPNTEGDPQLRGLLAQRRELVAALQCGQHPIQSSASAIGEIANDLVSLYSANESILLPRDGRQMNLLQQLASARAGLCGSEENFRSTISRLEAGVDSLSQILREPFVAVRRNFAPHEAQKARLENAESRLTEFRTYLIDWKEKTAQLSKIEERIEQRISTDGQKSASSWQDVRVQEWLDDKGVGWVLSKNEDIQSAVAEVLDHLNEDRDAFGGGVSVGGYRKYSLPSGYIASLRKATEEDRAALCPDRSADARQRQPSLGPNVRTHEQPSTSNFLLDRSKPYAFAVGSFEQFGSQVSVVVVKDAQAGVYEFSIPGKTQTFNLKIDERASRSAELEAIIIHSDSDVLKSNDRKIVHAALEKYSGHLVASRSFWNSVPVTPSGKEFSFFLHNANTGSMRRVTYEELLADAPNEAAR